MAKKTRSVFPEGTETSLSALQHRPKCDWARLLHRSWETSRGKALPYHRTVHHGPAPCPWQWVPSEREGEPRRVCTCSPGYLHPNAPCPGSALGRCPSLPGHGLYSLSPAVAAVLVSLVCSRAGGHTRSPWEAHPGLQGPKPIAAHPQHRGSGGSTRQFLVPAEA